MIIFLAQNNVDHGLILDYLQAKESNSTTQLNTEMVQLQGELNTERQRGEKEVVRLQGELNLERERGDKEVVRLKGELQLMTAQYLQLKGKLDMRGLMGETTGSNELRVACRRTEDAFALGLQPATAPLPNSQPSQPPTSPLPLVFLCAPPLQRRMCGCVWLACRVHSRHNERPHRGELGENQPGLLVAFVYLRTAPPEAVPGGALVSMQQRVGIQR